MNIEGDDLDPLEIAESDSYIERARLLTDEPEANVRVYKFFTPWSDEPRLRLVAADAVAIAVV